MKTLGVYVDSHPIRSIGDTLGVTAVLPLLHSRGVTDIDIVTSIPELFDNNPYVRSTLNPAQIMADTMLQACRQYDCNIVNNYANQLGLTGTNLQPELYLTDEELTFGKDILEKFKPSKVVAVCLNSSADSRDLRYHRVKPLLDRLSSEGHKLIAIGNTTHEDGIFDLSLLGSTTLRQVASIIKACDVYLGVDTGLFHIAAALDTPQVVFFRNNGCCNNKYTTSYFTDSLVKCSSGCHQPSLVTCHSPHNRCMDNFDLNAYYSLTQKALNT